MAKFKHPAHALLVKKIIGTTEKPSQQKRFNLRSLFPFSRHSTKISALQSELDLLTSYSADTIYRLHYETMHYDYVSPSITRLLGFSPQEMKKLNFRELILETRIVTNGMKAVESYDDLERQRKEGDVNKWQADYLVRTKDGRKIWVSDISYPWFDDRGKIIGSIGSLRDITERVQVESEIKEELEKLTNIDALTDLANRREFFYRLDHEMKRIRRNQSEVSILVIDIDHFRRINEQFGHDIGDAVIMQVADIIRKQLRETDLAARIGGEEFGVFLPDTPIEGAYWVAERIRLSIAKALMMVGADKTPVGVTVSIGAATATVHDELDATEIYKMADTRLYIAKHTGRNQVSVDEILQTH